MGFEHLKLVGKDEAVCYTTSLRVSARIPKYIVVDIKCKKGECHVQTSNTDIIAFGDFECGDKIEVFEREIEK